MPVTKHGNRNERMNKRNAQRESSKISYTVLLRVVWKRVVSLMKKINQNKFPYININWVFISKLIEEICRIKKVLV